MHARKKTGMLLYRSGCCCRAVLLFVHKLLRGFCVRMIDSQNLRPDCQSTSEALPDERNHAEGEKATGNRERKIKSRRAVRDGRGNTQQAPPAVGKVLNQLLYVLSCPLVCFELKCDLQCRTNIDKWMFISMMLKYS